MTSISQTSAPDDFIETQRERLAIALANAGVEGQPYAVLDFPDHRNIGDSSIWVGEAEFLGQYMGRGPAYVSTHGQAFSAETLNRVMPDGVILLHGGGNFGDIWKPHQDFRLQVLDRFKDRHVVQLSQTLHFQDSAELERTKAAVGSHKNFHLLVRDRRSYDLARTHFQCSTQLAPDFAFGILKPLQRSTQRYDAVFLMRDDVEAARYDISAFKRVARSKVCDWPYSGRRSLSLLREIARLRGRAKGWTPERVRIEDYNLAARWRADRGARLLSEGRFVVTDRLHAHILSTLLGIPNVVLDNNYGKVHAYRDQWTAAAGGSVAAYSVEEALERLRAYASEGPDDGFSSPRGRAPYPPSPEAPWAERARADRG